MKIVLVHCHYFQTGGEDVVFQQERELLERAGHQVLLYRRNNSETDSYPGMKRLVLLQKAIWNSSARDEFTELLQREKPDLVHVHNTWVMISPSIYSACREAGVPVVQTLHNYRLLCPMGTFFRDGHICEECVDHSLWRSIRNGCYRDSRAETAAVGIMLAVHRRRQTWENDVTSYIVLTDFARKKFLNGGLPENKLFVKPNFVDPDPLPRSGDGDYAIFAGRLSPERRVSTLLDAWTLLRNRVPLKIVGGGEERAHLQQKADWKELDMVEFTGLLPHDQTVGAIKGARFLIFASEWYETFGLTMIEAFASGVPVICSRLGAMQEIVEDGRTGLHFDPGNYRDLAEKVDWAWNHPEQMREMGKSARLEYENKYTAEKNYPRLMEIYEDAIARNRAESARAQHHSRVPSTAQNLSLTAAERLKSAPTEIIAKQAMPGQPTGNAPLKVVIAHNYYQLSGGEDETMRREGELLRSAGHDVKEFIRRNSEIAPSNVAARAGLAVRTIWSESSRKSMLAFLKETRPDVVHFHNTFPLMSPSVYYACRDADVPVVQTLHNPRLICPGGSLERDNHVCEDCKGKRIAWSAAVHACYRQSHIQSGVAAAMLAVHWQLRTWQEMISIYVVSTPFYRRKFIEAGFPEEKIFVKPHFVEDPEVTHCDRGYAVFVGRLANEKGVPILLRALEKVPNVPLKIRGDGPCLLQVEELARKSGGRVEILPRLNRKELNHLIAGARFLIWPSQGYYETFGYVAVEAFSCGVPVVASRVGVAEEIVQDGITGLHFTANDPHDLASKVEWAWSHPAEMEAMGGRARTEYIAKYTPERNYPMLMEVYRRAMGVSADRELVAPSPEYMPNGELQSIGNQ
jgi:glycosyltransferase involved in cell wall biosynthesis